MPDLMSLGHHASAMSLPRRALRDGSIVAGWLFLGYLFLVVAPAVGTFGFDAYAYWSVDPQSAYAQPVGALGSFNYAPPVALVASTFGRLEWWVFDYLWTMLLVGSVIFLGWTRLLVLAAFALPFTALELYHGNIHILLAVAIVLGFRHPWTWSFILLTKPTMGVGLLWFVVRREWRQLAIALGVTAVIAGASWIVAPSLWADYIDHLVGSTGFVANGSPVLLPLPLWLRLAVGAVIVVWGARTDRRWTVAVAATLALPVVWFAGAAVLLAVIPELRGWMAARTNDAVRSRVVADRALEPSVLPSA